MALAGRDLSSGKNTGLMEASVPASRVLIYKPLFIKVLCVLSL